MYSLHFYILQHSAKYNLSEVFYFNCVASAVGKKKSEISMPLYLVDSHESVERDSKSIVCNRTKLKLAI